MPEKNEWSVLACGSLRSTTHSVATILHPMARTLQRLPCRPPGSNASTLLRSLVSTVAAASLASWALQYRYGSLALHRQPLAWKLVAVARSQSLAL